MLLSVKSLYVVFVKPVSALRTEFGRVCRVFGLPAAFIASVKRRAGRLGGAAVLTEFTLVKLSAGAFQPAGLGEPHSVQKLPSASAPQVQRQVSA